MRDGLQKALRNMGHNMELYATLGVCGLLLFLKILHVVEDHWINSAILVTLMLLAVGALRDRASNTVLLRALGDLKLKSSDEYAVRWYTCRSDATAKMLVDMDSFQHLVFMGISHCELPSYLREKLHHGNTPLPWESIEIYFASNLLGEAYEGKEDFGRNLSNSRQEIAALLTDPGNAERIPNLRSVSFFQHDGIATHTGSMFGTNPSDLAVIYVVHSVVRLHGDTHEGLTIRLANTPGNSQDDRFDHYDGLNRALSKSSVRLGTFARSIWDMSAQRWADYARQSKVLTGSATIVADMISARSVDSILDIGSGSGDSAGALVERHPNASIVLLDGSPQMVRGLRDRFKNESRVRFALCQLPAMDRENIDFGTERFSVIVIHQSLSELIESFTSVDALAEWSRGCLQLDGRVLVTADNMLVETETPPGFGKWPDPFRAELRKKLKRLGHVRSHMRGTKPVIKQDEIKAAFARYGFELKDHRQQVFDLDYEERRRMWHVPAVMGCMADLSKVGTDRVEALVDEIADSLSGKNTMPRTVVFFLFVLSDQEAETVTVVDSHVG